MTKADIINEISLTTGLQKKDVSAVVEAFMETIKTHMVDEKENIYLRGFGSFIVKHRAQKIGRIISKNTSTTIPAHDFPGFKPAKCFSEEMKNK